VLALALGTPAAARMTYGDVVGDANAVNTQGERGFGHGGDVSTGPASAASADITGVTFAKRVRDGRVWAYAVKVTVAGPVRNGTMFSVFAVTSNCDPVVVKHVRTAEGKKVTDLTTSCDGIGRTIRRLPPAKVRGNRVIMTVPLRALPGPIRKGSVLREIYAYTVAVGPDVKPFLHAPKLDIASTGARYRIGR
jgi:hypothetical protein